MKILQCKRFFIIRSGKNNVKVRGALFYKNDISSYQILTKPKHSLNDYKPEIVPINSARVQAKKIADVQDLLKTHWGEEWEKVPNLKWYVKVFDNIDKQAPMGENEEQNEEELCCFVEEPTELII